MGDHLFTGKPSQYVTGHLGELTATQPSISLG